MTRRWLLTALAALGVAVAPFLQACAKIMTGTLSPSPSGRNELLVASRMISSTTSLAVEPAITTFGFLDNLIAFVVWHLYRHSVWVKDAVRVALQIEPATELLRSFALWERQYQFRHASHGRRRLVRHGHLPVEMPLR